MTSSAFIIYCHIHNNLPLIFGCTEPSCKYIKVLCAKCLSENPQHELQHKKKFVSFMTFLDLLANLLSKEAAPAISGNVRKLFENEQTYYSKLETHFRMEKEFLGNGLDAIVTAFVQQVLKIKKEMFDFLDIQLDNFKKNVSMFKIAHSKYNPQSKFEKYTNPNFLKSKLLSKTPLEAYEFLLQMEKGAIYEGNALLDVNTLANHILATYSQPPTMPLSKLQCLKDEAHKLFDSLKTSLYESSSRITLLGDNYVIASKTNCISHDRKSVKIERLETLTSEGLSLCVTKTFPTQHSNSITAIIALTEDIIATSSYDRTIKIFRISTNSQLLTLNDKNSVCSLCVFHFASELKGQTGLLTPYLSSLDSKIIQNPTKSISENGIYLLSGGFDKILKAWDFDFSANEQRIEPYYNYEGHNNWITNILYLEDLQNVASGDDGGELIIWNILQGKELFRHSVFHNCLISCIILIEPYKKFATSSADSIRLWGLKYENEVLINCNCIRSFNNDGLIFSMICPKNYSNLLIVTGRDAIIRYLDLRKGKVLFESKSLHKNSYLAEMILIEKNIKVFDEDYNECSNNFNIMSLGNNCFNIHNGLGQFLRGLEPDNNEDFTSNSVLPNRNAVICGIDKNQREITIKIAIASQFSSQYYNYKSSRVSIVELKTQVLI